MFISDYVSKDAGYRYAMQFCPKTVRASLMTIRAITVLTL